MLVVDDHPVVRGGVVGMLAAQPDIDVVGEAGDGLEALALVAEHAPDVVLMDLRMPRMDGVAATARIAAAHPGVHVLVLTTYDTDADIVRAVEAGATGYLLKDTPAAAARRRGARGGPGRDGAGPAGGRAAGVTACARPPWRRRRRARSRCWPGSRAG